MKPGRMLVMRGALALIICGAATKYFRNEYFPLLYYSYVKAFTRILYDYTFLPSSSFSLLLRQNIFHFIMLSARFYDALKYTYYVHMFRYVFGF